MDTFVGKVKDLKKERVTLLLRRRPDKYIFEFNLDQNKIVLERFVDYGPIIISENDEIIVTGLDKTSFLKAYGYYNISQKQGSDFAEIGINLVMGLSSLLGTLLVLYNFYSPVHIIAHSITFFLMLMPVYIIGTVYFMYQIWAYVMAYKIIRAFIKTLNLD